MKDLIKRSILKTLREFSKLNVIPTIEDLYYSLDTSEFKNPSIKKPLFDEAFEELVNTREVLTAKIEDILLVALADSGFTKINDILDYHRVHRKDIKSITKTLNRLSKLPFVLNISTLNLLPAKEGPENYVYIFVKNNSRNLTKFLTKNLLWRKRRWLRHIKIIEFEDIKEYFVERQTQSAYKLANLKAIFNNDNFYENLIYKNRWVFEILGNFPVSRISLNYKSSSKNENYNASLITKMFNKIFRIF